jgi:hypothetical protein
VTGALAGIEPNTFGPSRSPDKGQIMYQTFVAITLA